MDDPLPPEAFERMAACLYEYGFGMITFLELLERFEEILGLPPPTADHRSSDNEKECSII